MNICTLNKIAACGTSRLGSGYTVTDTLEGADGVMVRSAAMHDMELPASLLAIARAGAGVNNIPVTDCAEKGIVVFNTPGANANAVKELVLAGLLLSSRKVVKGIEWAATLKEEGDAVGKLVEKGKGAFVGPEIAGKTLGVIGLGAIGVLVANAAVALGMDVYGYDPYLSVDAAWKLSDRIHHATSLEQIYAMSDYITVHVPLNDATRHTFNAASIAQMKDGVRLLNFARGELADSAAVIDALAAGKVAASVTDFPDATVIGVDGVIAIPHLGASTPESEDNCAVMAADELRAYLENGSIVNSVNYPTLELGPVVGTRVCALHRNVPNMLTQISGLVSAEGVNIETMVSKSKKDFAYTVLDCAGDVSDETLARIGAIEGVIRVRKI